MLTQFLRDEEGQTTVEYLLIIAVVVVVISVLGKQMQKKIGDLVTTIFAGVDGQVKLLMKGAGQ
jgi:Flp pilus assembly pilin Flp